MLGTLITGGLGLYGMMKGNKMMSSVGQNQPSEKDLRGAFTGSQGLLDRMTNFNQYSGGAMDLATQAGNQGVQDAMMMGMGGSQANAIRNRLKAGMQNKAYATHQAGLGNALTHQMGMDKHISGQLEGNRQYQDAIKMQQANAMMGMGQGMLGEDGLLGLTQSVLGGIGIKK
tara:strand:+ start:317 stop:832 length:516 start_codon:yes stop_codon:yes gene_type:complete